MTKAEEKVLEDKLRKLLPDIEKRADDLMWKKLGWLIHYLLEDANG